MNFFTVFMTKSTEAAEKLGTFSFYVENDLVSETDSSYTSGMKLSYISPDLTEYIESGKLPDWSQPYICKLPFINKPGLKRNLSFSIGQSIYTPEDISSKELVGNDCPYAGWTYFGVGFYSKNDWCLDSLEIQLGIVGPESFAEETQKFVHKLIGSKRPEGWDNQIKNEPGLAFVYERKWRIVQAEVAGGLDFDAIPYLGGTLGNVYTYANTGIEARLGWNIPVDFGTCLIRPAGDTNAPMNENDPRLSIGHDISLYIFALIDGRAVLHNIFLDGNTFTNSHSVDKKHFVADVGGGIGLIINRFNLTYTHVLRTKEFNGQQNNHVFGSIILSFSY